MTVVTRASATDSDRPEISAPTAVRVPTLNTITEEPSQSDSNNNTNTNAYSQPASPTAADMNSSKRKSVSNQAYSEKRLSHALTSLNNMMLLTEKISPRPNDETTVAVESDMSSVRSDQGKTDGDEVGESRLKGVPKGAIRMIMPMKVSPRTTVDSDNNAKMNMNVNMSPVAPTTTVPVATTASRTIDTATTQVEETKEEPKVAPKKMFGGIAMMGMGGKKTEPNTSATTVPAAVPVDGTIVGRIASMRVASMRLDLPTNTRAVINKGERSRAPTRKQSFMRDD